jgi:hypothetical protein
MMEQLDPFRGSPSKRESQTEYSEIRSLRFSLVKRIRDMLLHFGRMSCEPAVSKMLLYCDFSNRLEVILDRVLGQRHLTRHPPGVAARGKQAEQFVFAGTQAESPAEKLDPLRGGRFLDSDDDRCRSAGGGLVRRKPGGT